jgi:hypothetical protein
MTEKVDFLLAALRGQPPPSEGQAAAEEQMAPLRSKIEELERKLSEMAAPKAEEGAAADLEPPKPPTELVLFLQTRMDLLERRLEMAQQEALRANLVLREREEAQKKAQGEVEELFRSIREQERAARFDRKLREGYSATQSRVEELQARLAMAQLRMVPAEDVLSCLSREEGLAELRERIQTQLSSASSPHPPEAALVPCPEPSQPSRGAPDKDAELPALSVVMARMADLELRLEEAQKARQKEREGRLLWENNILSALRQSSSRWQQGGGAGLLVEATLESMVDLIQKRDGFAAETAKILDQLAQEPSGSEQAPLLRARLAELQKAAEDVQPELDKKLAIINAWIERDKGKDT